MAIKLRRGLEAERTTILFEQGEIIYAIDSKKVYIGDGLTLGGNLVSGKEILSNLNDITLNALSNGNLLIYDSSLQKWKNITPTTTNILEGTNLYYTDLRFDNRLLTKTTTNLAEGTNLYFTDTRVYTKVKASLIAGSNTSISFDDALQTITIASQGNVQSVNTQTGAVVLTTTDIGEGTNEYFTAARVRAVLLTGLSLATNAVISATDSVLIAFGKLQAQITANLTTLTTHVADLNNPHAVTKTQVGLSNVDNTSDANKPISSATQTALNLKQDTLVSGTNIKTINGDSIVGSGNIVTSVELEYRHDFNVFDYLGKAPSDSLESDNVWTITRLTIASDGTATVGTATNVDWTNRYTHIYT
jgi:hypothetical protein